MKIKIILLSLLILLILLTACSKSNTDLGEVQSGNSEIQTIENQEIEQESLPETQNIESPLETQDIETPAFSFQENYCPLTVDMVKQYCDINFELLLDRENCQVNAQEGTALAFYPISIKEEYSSY